MTGTVHADARVCACTTSADAIAEYLRAYTSAEPRRELPKLTFEFGKFALTMPGGTATRFAAADLTVMTNRLIQRARDRKA